MTRGTRRVALLFALLSLAAFAAVGGDEALTQPQMPLTQQHPLAVKVGGFLGLQHYLDCQRSRSGKELRFQVAHKPDAWPVRVECAYGPAFPRGAI